MSKTSVSLQINDLSMSWDEKIRRTLKPCKFCEGKTKGRMVNTGGVVSPAHQKCAIEALMKLTIQLFTKVVTHD